MKNLEVKNIGLSKIKTDPNQPRKTFNDASLLELSNSIKKHGVLQPITLRKENKDYILVMGERRFKASQILGKKTIPAIIKTFKNDEILEIQIIENLQRENVDPLEEAQSISYLKDFYKIDDIANRIGRSLSFVKQRIKLATLIEPFHAFVRNGNLNLSTAVTIALFDEKEQISIYEEMVQILAKLSH